MKWMTWLTGFFIMTLSASLTGCDDSKDNFDETPAQGNGTLIVDNGSGTDCNVFVDGLNEGSVNNDHYIARDIQPGQIRVFIRSRDGDHYSHGKDVDILEGRRTILRLTFDGFNDFKINVEYD